MKAATVSEIRALDRAAIERFGITAELLMENAGQAVYRVIARECPIEGRRFVVFCGLGNNGGDGLVVARLIHANGGTVRVFVLGDPGRFEGSAAANYAIVSRLAIAVQQIHNVEPAGSEVDRCDCIVDAILGTGLTRQVAGLYRDVIELINASEKTVFSVDIPSGVHGDSAAVVGVAVRADHTVTFGLPKTGNLLFPGFAQCGKLYVSRISFPPSLYHSDTLAIQTNDPRELAPGRSDAHVGEPGRALFLVGASGDLRAPLFTVSSFRAAGGGEARLAAPKSIAPLIAAKGNQPILVPRQETESGNLAVLNKPDLLDLAKSMCVVILGSGLDSDKETRQLVRKLAGEIEVPLLIGGDGMNAFGGALDLLKDREAETILMPDVVELSRITNMTAAEMEADRVGVLQKAAREWSAILVLGAAHSLVVYPDRRVFINMSGNASLGIARSGDVLIGTVAAMLALGLGPREAARTGVFLHGLAADLASQDKGEDGIWAQDILECLPRAAKLHHEGLNEELSDRYRGAQVV